MLVSSNSLLRGGDNTGHAVVGPVAAQGQITILLINQNIIYVPKHNNYKCLAKAKGIDTFELSPPKWNKSHAAAN